MAILFISSLVPDNSEFHNEAFTRSGNNVLYGIARKLYTDDKDSVFISCRPVPSYPGGKLWISSEKVKLDFGAEIYILPTLNIKLLKNLFWNIFAFFYIICWAFKRKGKVRDILVYNIYIPSISTCFYAARLTRSKLFTILYDLGVPPQRLGLGTLTMLSYKWGERMAKRFIPKIDGRIIINESIIDHYSPGKDYLLIDGGINDQIVSNLFELKKSKNDTLVFVLAGMLWDQNGTKLMLDVLKAYPDLDIKVVFAGKGVDVPIIKEASRSDDRIEYAGFLTMSEVVALYERADVLLNLRIEEELDFHFPSKLLEYMVMGKTIISTDIAHVSRDYSEYIYVLKEASPCALYELIQGILGKSKDELYQVGLKARQFMLERRTWDSRTEEIEYYIRSKH